MLNIFHTGGLTLGITLFWLALTGLFLYQAYKAHNSGGTTQTKTGQVYDDLKTPYHKIPQFWFAVVLTVLYGIALLVIS